MEGTDAGPDKDSGACVATLLTAGHPVTTASKHPALMTLHRIPLSAPEGTEANSHCVTAGTTGDTFSSFYSPAPQFCHTHTYLNLFKVQLLRKT